MSHSMSFRQLAQADQLGRSVIQIGKSVLSKNIRIIEHLNDPDSYREKKALASYGPLNLKATQLDRRAEIIRYILRIQRAQQISLFIFNINAIMLML